jgi:hypothetical protein
MPAFAQYAGPAILSRGEAPAAMEQPQINFRPYFDVNAVYDTGLAGVIVTDQGQLATAASAGIQFAGGISGAHSWRHTKLGLDYHGSVFHFFRKTYYDSTNQSLLLSVTHQFTRHAMVTLRETAGTFSQDFGLLGLSDAVSYDPAQTYIPTTDFFDNRTVYFASQANLTLQASSRLSLDLGGDFFLVRRRSSALAAVTGVAPHADIQYRVTRRSTIGLNYTFADYSYAHVYSNSEVHGTAFSYSTRLSRTVEFSAYGGIMRVESKFIQTVPVDPAITELLGITSGVQLFYHVNYLPTYSARLSRAVQKGVLYAEAKRTMSPGNGLFLTSNLFTAGGGYTYTGLRRWSFNLAVGYDDSKSVMNIVGRYRDYRGGLQMSRQVSRSIHAIMGVNASKYNSPDFAGYNHLTYEVRAGFGWAPGDVPIHIW